MVDKIPYRFLLGVLTFIFATRVSIQFTLQFWNPGFFPIFDLWHSNTMPYSKLLTIQCVFIAVMLAGILYNPRQYPKIALTLMCLGWLYVTVMVARLIIGTFEISAHSWFDGAVSTAFHFGLAAYILVFGASLRSISQEGTKRSMPVVQYCAYPSLLIVAYLLFVWLVDTGAPQLFSAYLTVMIAAISILFHETFLPSREDWRPTAKEIIRDGLFLTLVQVALPAVLKGLALVLIVWMSNNSTAPIIGIWPSDAPILVQVAIMLVVAEFFRYWMHRTFHKNRILWKLHAVHHAADKLYTINVGRFHPLDKSLQFLGDTLPFLLLGVSPDVFAAYFVLYAINGFYQHSNADVRLGFLNWIIAGPELHRWHHSAIISEAHSNYGNNLILWDSIFGTRHLPKGQQVCRVGIGNTDWPEDFLGQMSAPFTTSTEVSNKE